MASIFVGGSLFLVYEFWMPTSPYGPAAWGFLLPLLVYRFSIYWNGSRFDWRTATSLSLAMGVMFILIHHLPVPHPLMTASGFAAPLFVSWIGSHAVVRREAKTDGCRSSHLKRKSLETEG